MKLKLLIICLSVISLLLSPVYADTLNDLKNQLNQVNEDINETKSVLNNIKSQKQGIMYEKEKIEKAIDLSEKEITEIEKLIMESEESIEKKNKELMIATQKADEQYDLLKKRLLVMYEEGDVSYLEILFRSASFSEFLSGMEVVKDIVEFDKELFDELEGNKKIQYKLNRELQAEKVKRENLKSEIVSKKSELEEQEAARGNILTELTTKEQKYEEALDSLAETSKDVELKLKKLQEQNKRKYAGGELAWPCPGNYTITSKYGYRIHPITKTRRLHSGVDIAASSGTKVVAANSGVVVYADYNGGYGKCVIIDHGGGIATLYGHNSSLEVKVNQEVKKGDLISKVGSTGVSTGPHLHFEVRINGATTDPMEYFK